MERLEQSIRRNLALFLAGSMSLEEFTSWLVRTTWNVDNSGEPEASHLTYSVELALAEHSAGVLSFEELRDELRALSQVVVLNFSSSDRRKSPYPVNLRPGSGSQTITPNDVHYLRSEVHSLVQTQPVAAFW